MSDETSRVPAGTRVRYHGRSGRPGEYIIRGYNDPAAHHPQLPPDVVAEAYPDGVAYELWPAGVLVKFGNRDQTVFFVRRTSFDIVAAEGGQRTTPGTPVTWHLDSSVWKRARLGRCQAEMWCIEIDGETGWAVFGPDDMTARHQGIAPTPEEAQTQAEEVLRAVREAAS